ncbi:MAG: hypothetical protein DCO97_13420 [Marivita sp. XM-24bin2]|nr:MAG: hypothetical protein DCO97_13420 [Marivita sp. XM-24bin2]
MCETGDVKDVTEHWRWFGLRRGDSAVVLVSAKAGTGPGAPCLQPPRDAIRCVRTGVAMFGWALEGLSGARLRQPGL